MRTRATSTAATVLARALVCAGCVAVLVSPVGADQTPHDAWRTVETPSFRVHFPASWEPWARHVAARLEPVRDTVVEAVGFRPEGKVDVVLADPIGRPNAMAISLLRSPRMVLFATPPPADSPIGAYRDWTDLLVLHEDVHLVHLLRPSRSPVGRWRSRGLGLGPLTTAAPRWMIEGYATLLEGRLTGSGRPNADFRAAILRARARAGTLPPYPALGAVGDGWQDGAMAYLAGSAFLEWLEARSGPEALPDLWRSLSARERRSFDGAFHAVFGEPPAKLYGRFAAELTWRAMTVERAFTDGEVAGEPVLEARGATGPPAVAPDGASFALVQRPPGESPTLVVHALAPDEQAERDREAEIAEILRRDPEDVPPVAPSVRPRKRLHVLETRNGADPHAPRFLPDGAGVLFHRFVPDGDGILRADLFVWTLADGAVRRVTEGADVRDADPAPGGHWAVAVRNRGGVSTVVKVDLHSGAVEPWIGSEPPDVFDRPRVSPDGARVAYLRHRDGRWRPEILDVATRRGRAIPIPDDVDVSGIAWHPDGIRLLTTIGRDGFLDVAELDTGGASTPRLWTRSIDGAIAPEPIPGEDAVLFLSLDADGADVARIPAPTGPGRAGPALDRSLAPAVRPESPEAPPRGAPDRGDRAPFEPRPYRFGRAEWRALAASSLAPSARQWRVGLRAGDVLGRWESVIQIAGGDPRSVRGAAVGATWRGWPVETSARAFVTGERPSRQDLVDPAVGTDLDLDRDGVELGASWTRRPGTATSVIVRVGAGIERIETRDGGSLDREIGFAAMSTAWRPSRGRRWIRLRGSAALAAGSTDGDGWTRASATVGAAAGVRGIGVAADGSWADVDDAVAAFDRVVLGGTDGAVLPSTAVVGRVVAPALPVGTRIGDRYRGLRASVEFGASAPVVAYWETHRVDRTRGPDAPPVDLVGVEWRLDLGPRPLFRIPALSLGAGVAHVVRDPTGRLEGRTRGWVTVSFRP